MLQKSENRQTIFNLKILEFQHLYKIHIIMEGKIIKIRFKEDAGLIHADTLSILKTLGWWGLLYIHNGAWNRYRMSQNCHKISEWHIRRGLQLNKNQAANMVKQISHIGFPKLLYISMEFNMIQSIQGLVYLRAPQLLDISLASNSITTIQSFRKCNFKKIEGISFSIYQKIIGGNKIKDFSHLSELRSSKLQRLFFEYQQDNEYCEDISYLSKIESLSLKYACVWCKRMIKNRIMFKQIRKMRKNFCLDPKKIR